jgi:two-component system cell cycle response regulator
MTILADQEQQASPQGNQAQPAKILIVEDTDDHRFLMKTALEQASYEVVDTPGANHALVYAERWAPDLILLDIMLPGSVDGWEVLQRLKADERTAYIPVIVVSALSRNADLLRAKVAGAADYLTKPCRVDELLMRVQRTLAAHSVTPQQKQLRRGSDVEDGSEEQTRNDEPASV